MAIEKVEMFTVVCDNCKLDIGTDAEYYCWNDDFEYWCHLPKLNK